MSATLRKWIKKFKRNRAVKSYIRKLPRQLAKDYGKSRTYSPQQVRKSIERSKLSVADACYGIAMFSGREAFDIYHRETGETCNFDAMRSEIAEKFFDGNCDFEVSDISSVSSDFGDTAGTDSGASHDSGGGNGGSD